VLRQDALYPHPERLVSFIGNHDTVRFLTEAGGSAPKAKLALGLVITLRGTPQIYSGDEIGMDGKADPDNRHDFPGGFAGDTHTAFSTAGRTAKEEEIFSWTADLLALRGAHSVLQTGMEQNLFADEDVFAFVRSPDGLGCPADHAKERYLIVVNKAQQSKRIQLPQEGTALAGCTAFVAAQPKTASAPEEVGGSLQIEAPAESMTVYAVR
jgi:glycosidase